MACTDQYCTSALQLGNFSGNDVPDSQTSATGVMRILWKTDKMYTSHGWSARWDSKGSSGIRSALLGIPDGRRPMRVVVPRLGPVLVQQSAPVTSAVNTLNFTVGCQNIECAEGTTFIISGFSVASTSTIKTQFLEISGLDKRYFNERAEFDPSAHVGILKLKVAQGQIILAGSSVTFSVQLRNVAASREAITLTITGSGNETLFGLGALSFPKAIMQSPVSSLLGVPLGYRPFQLLKPHITKAIIVQTTPFTGHINTLIVTLSFNIDLMVGSRITISGLSNSGLISAPNFLSLSGGGSRLFGGSGNLDMKAGTLKLSVVDLYRKISANSDVSFRFSLFNNNSEHISTQELSITAAGSDFGYMAMNFDPIAMSSPKGRLFGVRNGFRPFNTVVPGLDVAVLSQSTISMNDDLSMANVITVTVKTNVDCLAGSRMAISGLLDQGPNIPDVLLLNGSAASVFGGSAVLDVVNGVLTFIVAEDEVLAGHSLSVLSFKLMKNLSATQLCSFNLSCG